MRRMLHLRSTKLILTRVEGQRTIMGDLEGVVERLCDVGEVGSEGELGDDMRQIHDYDLLQRLLRDFGSRKNARL